MSESEEGGNATKSARETLSPRQKSLANLKPWAPGQSGNVKGRPRIEPRVRRYARKFDRQMCQVLADIAMDKEVAPAERRRAAMDLIAVGSGRPALVQEIGGRGGEPMPMVNISIGDRPISNVHDAARVYAEICGNPAADLDAITFAAPEPPVVAPAPQPAVVDMPPDPDARSDGKQRLWEKLGQ